MSYYVLLWNPAGGNTEVDEIAAMPTEARNSRWNCGRRTDIVPGDMVVMRRTGRQDKGIVGIGTVTEGSKPGLWGGSEEPGLFIVVAWERMQLNPIIDRDDPQFSAIANLWSGQISGVRISDNDGAALFNEVRTRVDWSFVPTDDDAAQENRQFHEGQLSRRMMAYRGRHASVREHCLAGHPPTCAACTLDPAVQFGTQFATILEVHHLDPMSQNDLERTTDPVKDCAPLCPNCHRLAHLGMGPTRCRTLAQIREIASRTK